MSFKTEKPYVPIDVTRGDMALASIAFGWTLGFGYFAVLHALRETRRARRVTTYVILIWGEILVCLAFAIICWLYLYQVIPPSFAFFFTILTSWALQVQFLLQIIVNRLCILLPDEKRRNILRYGIAGLILAVNISVYCIWVPAKLQINQKYHDINVWWDRCEKCIYLVVDAALNYYFMWTVKDRLVAKGGLKKYQALINFNTRIIWVSLSMDVLIIAMMSLNNDFVYMQFHPVAYIVKLNIEMAMGNLIIKVARDTGISVQEGSTSGGVSRSGPTVSALEIQVERTTHTIHDVHDSHPIELKSTKWSPTSDERIHFDEQVRFEGDSDLEPSKAKDMV